MIDKIKGLRKYTDCSMPSNEQHRIEKAECAAYNQAIEDVVKLFAIPDVSNNEVKLKSLLEKLLEENMCSVVGDELIKEALKSL